MEKVIKVNVKQGVYVHKSGNLLTVEFGKLKNEETGEVRDAIKSVGTNIRGEESTRYVCCDKTEDLVLFANVIRESEYLGEL